MGITDTDELDAEYTDIDLNATGTTTIYQPSDNGIINGALIEGVYLKNDGGSAVARLEITDGTDTAVLTPVQTGGDSIEFTGGIALDTDDKLQINVTTAEGSAQTNTAVVGRGERK